jgi:hypothetical protein
VKSGSREKYLKFLRQFLVRSCDKNFQKFIRIFYLHLMQSVTQREIKELIAIANILLRCESVLILT